MKTKSPTVLVLSLPRSGSSWVGETLARARETIYLREPVTQSDTRFLELGTIFDLDREDVLDSYQRLADRAFAGLPDFDGSVVPDPSRWSLRQRAKRRLVIKEVNPLACDWYLRGYHPFLIHLVRHPAAVALSNQSKGFLPPNPLRWEQFGELQARASRVAWECLQETSHGLTISFETLCAEPIASFRRLFDAADLCWDLQVESYIQATTSDSWRRGEAWRQGIPADRLSALRNGYARYELPWYQEDSVWEAVPITEPSADER